MINYILLVIVIANLVFDILNKNISGSLGWATAAILVIGNISTV